MLYNLARVVTATAGTGTVTLGAAVGGYRTFANAGVPNGAVVRYAITDYGVSPVAHEYGTGVYTSSGTTLTRILGGSTTGALLNLSGNSHVTITAVAEDFAGTTFPPQGRLTLVTGTPVMASSVTGVTTVYYTPYVGQRCPIWDGVSFVMADLGGELTQTLSDATKSPAAAGNYGYDMFVWNDAGVPRCTRGFPWSSSYVRGTGAGTSELIRVNGILVNKYAITNGPAAGCGTYVGSIHVSSSGYLDHIFGSFAASGGLSVFRIWNMYNRVDIITTVADDSVAYDYSTLVWRAANNSTNNSITFFVGVSEEPVYLAYRTRVGSSSGSSFGTPQIGIGINSTSTPSDRPSMSIYGTSNFQGPSVTDYSAYILGHNTVYALEYGGTTSSFAPRGGGFSMRFRM
jgi:hypothetical protein